MLFQVHIFVWKNSFQNKFEDCKKYRINVEPLDRGSVDVEKLFVETKSGFSLPSSYSNTEKAKQNKKSIRSDISSNEG
jgi:hypothetical protein